MERHNSLSGDQLSSLGGARRGVTDIRRMIEYIFKEKGRGGDGACAGPTPCRVRYILSRGISLVRALE
jgi:hypothetical protein